MQKIVYLAGEFHSPLIPKYYERLSSIEGVKITHNWTLERDKPREEAAQFDIEGVCSCHIFLAVMDNPTYPYRGTFTELGAALALGKPILLVSPETPYIDASSNCFFWHPSIFHLSSFEAAERLLRCASKPHPKIMILGAGRHGKDTVADLLQKKGWFIFSSSSEAATVFIYPKLKALYGYNTEKECFDDRRNHRMEWYEAICEYNEKDRTKLASLIFASSDIYVGMRDDQEFEASRKLVDLVLWVDRSKIIDEEDPTLKISIHQADLIIDNNGSLEQLNSSIERLLLIIRS
jgi:hypothetical protein